MGDGAGEGVGMDAPDPNDPPPPPLPSPTAAAPPPGKDVPFKLPMGRFLGCYWFKIMIIHQFSNNILVCKEQKGNILVFSSEAPPAHDCRGGRFPLMAVHEIVKRRCFTNRTLRLSSGQ